ncbi:response regulator transcription factor [Flagellimonas aequoris]|uniref:Response regulator transcription factor n=2 Tax=Flagellimonas aequoris TaxID=2306997 RepID=A0ABY3KYS3_9FLAO|nr:LuxR C-terminal-related transcriptional regulator [Allomuricauda aequoris]TXK07613.1 response regulator transcription factor [Allomuricauda aequoris]
MRRLHYLVPLFFLLLMGSLHAGERFSFEMAMVPTDSVQDSLSSREWKKFKSFEAQLQSSQLSKTDKENQLTGYARDSLNILRVKLVAMKVLEEKNLLNRDIAENTSYYTTLLEKLKESEIPPSEYLFLEEKLAYLNQEALNGSLQLSRWMNIGLVLLVAFLGYMLFRQRKRQDKTILPELSKQETMVRNLILQGKSNKEIANELFISLSTVKSHITNIYGKLNISNRRELLENSTGAST